MKLYASDSDYTEFISVVRGTYSAHFVLLHSQAIVCKLTPGIVPTSCPLISVQRRTIFFVSVIVKMRYVIGVLAHSPALACPRLGI